MADSSLRSLERAAASDPLAAARLIEAKIRAGGRDPRRDPRWGDTVRSVGTGVESLRPVKGGARYEVSRDVVRVVDETWPRRLASLYLLCRPAHPAMAAIHRTTLPAKDDDLSWLDRGGAQVLRVESWQRSPLHPQETTEWRLVARPGPDGPWIELLCITEPETRHDSSIPVEEVAYHWESGRGGRRERTSIAAWRRWAKRASVDFVGLSCCVCAAPLDRGGVKDEGGNLTCHGCEA